MSFCKFLTNTRHFTYDVVKPCCWIKDTSVSILDHKMIKSDFKWLNQIDTWIPECSYCYKLEANGTDSPRTRSLREDIFNHDHAVGDTIKIELQLDEDCNAACIMCSDFNSTTWKKYNENTVKSKNIKIHHTTTVEQRIAAVEATVDFDIVRQIHFFGGEPFNTDTHLRILRQIKYPENTNLVYVTNGSTFPTDEALQLWKRFKHVNLAVSIDGIGEHFNYLRWPLQWRQIEENLVKYRSMISNQFEMNSSFTGSALNLYYVDRYTEWATEFFKDVKLNKLRYFDWFKNPHPVVGTMNLESVPVELKVAIGDKYGTDSRIFKIINQFNEIKYQKFIEYIEFHDQYRKLDFRTVFPEVAQYFKR